MFQRIASTPRDTVSLNVDGERIEACAGDTVAAALLAGGRLVCRRTPASGAARAPFCMMGVCFDCLMTIDGEVNQQACQIIVRDGMQVATQHGRPFEITDTTV